MYAKESASANIIKVINFYLVFCIFYDNVSAIRSKLISKVYYTY